MVSQFKSRFSLSQSRQVSQQKQSNWSSSIADKESIKFEIEPQKPTSYSKTSLFLLS